MPYFLIISLFLSININASIAEASIIRMAITGLPGAGKSTQIELLLKKYPNTKLLYLGQALRDHVANKEKYTDIILKHHYDSKQIPSYIIKELNNKMFSALKEGEGFILDNRMYDT